MNDAPTPPTTSPTTPPTGPSVRQVAGVGALATTTVGLSFAAQVVLVGWCGSGYETDAFFAAAVVPQVLFDLLVGSLSLALTPLLVATPRHQRRREVWTLAWAVGLLFAVFALLLAVTASGWSRWLLPGMSALELQLVDRLLQVSVVGTVLLAMSTVIGAGLRAEQRFVAAERATAAGAIIGLVALGALLPWLGVVAAPLAWVLRMATELTLATIAIGRPTTPNFRSNVLRNAVRKATPLVLGAVVFRTDLLVDRFLASMAPTGGLTLLAIARQLHHAAARLLSKAVVATVGPRLTQLWRAQDIARYRDVIHRRRRLTLTLASSALVALLLTTGAAAGLQLSAQAATATLLLAALAGVLLAEPVAQLSSVAHFARGDTATPARCAVVAYVASIGLRLAGFYLFGLVGVALGASAYFVLQALLLERSLFTPLGVSGTQAPPTAAPDSSRRAA